MENIEIYKNILKKVKDVEDLKELNHFLVKEIKFRNQAEALSNKGLFTQGQTVITKNIRPKRVNNQRATIVAIQLTRAIVRFERDNHVSSVPLQCLEAVE